jgi:hypothetical protein
VIGFDGRQLSFAVATAEELLEARKPATVDGAAAKLHTRADRMLKLTARDGDRVAVAYWGGTLRIADGQGAVKSEQLLPQDVTSLAWSQGKLIAALADGQVLALELK